MRQDDTILVTGASGLIGAALVRRLREEGFHKLLLPSHAQLELRNREETERYLAQQAPSHIFHLAARVGGIGANLMYPAQFIHDNIVMQVNMFEAARKANIKHILFPGSASSYPETAPQPIPESAFLQGPVESSTLAYATAKIGGIVMAQAYAKQYGMQMLLPMPTNCYGIGDKFDPETAHVIPALLTRLHEARVRGLAEVTLWGTGTPEREFIYADDLADAFLFLMQKTQGGDILNVGTMEPVSVETLAILIAGITGYKGRILFDRHSPDGAPKKVLDCTKLFSLGWRPRTTLFEGIARTYAHQFMGQGTDI